jgi:hypothetical protein
MNELENIEGFHINSEYVKSFKSYIGIIDSNTARLEISNYLKSNPNLSFVNHSGLYDINVDHIKLPLSESSTNVIVINIYDYKIWKDLIPSHILIRNETIDIVDITNHNYIFVIQSLFGRFIDKYNLSSFARVIIDNAYTSVLPRISFTSYPGFIWLLTSDRLDRDKPKSSCINILVANMVPHVNLKPKCYISKPCECQVNMSIIIGNNIQHINRDECLICYEPLDKDLLMSTCCRNAYHKRCYDNRSRCIICNTSNHSVVNVITDGLFSSLDEGLTYFVRLMNNPTIYMNRLIIPKEDKKILKKFSNVIPSDKLDPITLVKDGKCVKVRYLT